MVGFEWPIDTRPRRGPPLPLPLPPSSLSSLPSLLLPLSSSSSSPSSSSSASPSSPSPVCGAVSNRSRSADRATAVQYSTPCSPVAVVASMASSGSMLFVAPSPSCTVAVSAISTTTLLLRIVVAGAEYDRERARERRQPSECGGARSRERHSLASHRIASWLVHSIADNAWRVRDMQGKRGVSSGVAAPSLSLVDRICVLWFLFDGFTHSSLGTTTKLARALPTPRPRRSMLTMAHARTRACM